jgi:hypothetical protein
MRRFRLPRDRFHPTPMLRRFRLPRDRFHPTPMSRRFRLPRDRFHPTPMSRRFRLPRDHYPTPKLRRFRLPRDHYPTPKLRRFRLPRDHYQASTQLRRSFRFLRDQLPTSSSGRMVRADQQRARPYSTSRRKLPCISLPRSKQPGAATSTCREHALHSSMSGAQTLVPEYSPPDTRPRRRRFSLP